MKRTYTLKGMTCNKCVELVTEKLSALEGIKEVIINFNKSQVVIIMTKNIALKALADTLPDQYTISKKVNSAIKIGADNRGELTKLQQLKPLFLIFVYLFGATFLLHFKNWDTAEAMLNFMGLFYIVFSFFKFIDLKGFAYSFRMYDPLANIWSGYAWVYPFVELILGVLFLMRIQITLVLISTLVILGLTTIGVTKTLLDKKNMQCACLGTALKLPMTEATFIENAIMLLMAIYMLTTQV